MGVYVNRMQKTFGKTPIVFSTQAQVLADKKAKQILIGFGITLAIAGGIYIGYQIRKKWWPQDKPTKENPGKAETKLVLKEKPKQEVYSNFSGNDKKSRKKKRLQRKKEYFENRNKTH